MSDVHRGPCALAAMLAAGLLPTACGGGDKQERAGGGPDGRPDGSDDPDGRAKNRRVVVSAAR
ncbi:hypothetical protein GWI34_03290 [Actinomadura sp. DSM 109109]|nr:hypothetical protein [Actinomadura lepetitiana]